MRISDSDHNRAVSSTRRSVLRAAGLAAGIGVLSPLASGCDLLDQEPDPIPPPDPLTALHSQTAALAASYDESLLAQPSLAKTLGQVRDAHHAHVAALAAIMSPPPPSVAPSASASAGAPPTSASAKVLLAALRTAEKEAHKAAVEACVAAPASRAQLLGEIVAARATHLEVLR